jgi:hypothetical protein
MMDGMKDIGSQGRKRKKPAGTVMLCMMCRKPFDSHRRDTKFCSQKCRSANYFIRQFKDIDLAPLESVQIGRPKGQGKNGGSVERKPVPLLFPNLPDQEALPKKLSERKPKGKQK